MPSALRICPPVISFPEDSTLSVNSVQLENTDPEKYITYKIKTNAPDGYIVRPSNGILMPHETCEIQVILRGNNPDIKPTASDRFMVLAQFVDPQDSNTPVAQLWVDPPAEKLTKQMIKCQVSGSQVGSPSESLDRNLSSSASLYQSFLSQSNITGKLKKQNEEHCARVQKLSQDNKSLKEEKQKLQGTLQIMEQENHNTEVQLKKLKKGNSPAAICNLQGQGIIALVAFVSGYLIHYTGFI